MAAATGLPRKEAPEDDAVSASSVRATYSTAASRDPRRLIVAGEISDQRPALSIPKDKNAATPPHAASGLR